MKAWVFISAVIAQGLSLWYAWSIGKMTENLVLLTFGFIVGVGVAMITLKVAEL